MTGISGSQTKRGPLAFPIIPISSISAAFVDVDHDGDLDILVAGFADLRKTQFEPLLGKDGPFAKNSEPTVEGDLFSSVQNLPSAPNLLLRNNGNLTFTDITASAGLSGANSHAVAVVPADYDNRRDVDLLILNYKSAPTLFRNQRDTTFRRVEREAGLDVRGDWSCVAAGDVNKDGFVDFFFGRVDGPGVFALSDGRSHFKTTAAPSATAGATAVQYFDYDNDGLLDLLAIVPAGVRLWRNVGNSWIETGANTISLRSMVAGHGLLDGRSLALGDADNDGDEDVIVRVSEGGLLVLRNDGGNSNHSIKIDLHGKVSNRSAIETKVEMRAGSLYQKLETYSACPAPAPADLIFGLGKRERPDAVRVTWPAGIIQSETEFPRTSSAQSRLSITELDRKPSSCPYLYTWNGERFEFITDFMGGGEMGYLEEPARGLPAEPQR